MAGAILLTGGTSFLGTEIAAQLVRQSENTIYVLVRARDESHACARLKAAWKEQNGQSADPDDSGIIQTDCKQDQNILLR